MTIFGLKMMVKSGLEKFILKFHVPLQSCCCPVQKNLPRKAELAWLVSRGTWNFKTFFSRPLFTIILSQKWSFHNVLFSGMIRTFRTKVQSPSPICKELFFFMKLRIRWPSGSILAPCAKGPWLESGEKKVILEIFLHQFFQNQKFLD